MMSSDEMNKDMQSVLEPFWSFSDPDSQTRINAIKNLIEIHSVQEIGNPTHQYAMKRILRGLISSRAMARQGFVVAFSQILRACPNVDVESVSVFWFQSFVYVIS